MNQSSDPAADFLLTLHCESVDTATGVPCGVLKRFIRHFMTDDRILHLTAQSEPEAVGIAAGAYLGGRKPVLYMQNSGLIKALNEYTSLLIPYALPIPAIVTHRGAPGEQAPQHEINGRITIPCIESIGVPFTTLTRENARDAFPELVTRMRERDIPGVVLVRRGWTPSIEEKPVPMMARPPVPSSQHKILLGNTPIGREEALDTIMATSRPDDALFSTTGLMSRSLYERHDSPNQCYLTGSFGQASSVGYGFAAARPDITTIVIDGDASLLTNFGTLVSIGERSPHNLIHIVVDNNAYGSCAEEPTSSPGTRLTDIARTLGYAHTYATNGSVGLHDAIWDARQQPGPSLIHVRIALGGRRDFQRPKDLPYVAHRFKEHFAKTHARRR